MTVLVVPGADFSANAVGYVPAVPTGLEYLNFFTGSAVIGRNLAPGKGPATVVGAPTQGDSYATMTSLTDYVQTNVAQTPNFTFFVVAGAGTETANFLIGNFQSGSAAGAWLWNSNFTPGDSLVRPTLATNHNVDAPATVSLAGVEVAAPLAPTMLAAHYRTSSNEKVLWNATSGSLLVQTPDHPAVAVSANTYRVGSAVASAISSVTDIYFAAIYSRVLSTTERELVVNSVRAFYAARGIVI